MAVPTHTRPWGSTGLGWICAVVALVVGALEGLSVVPLTPLTVGGAVVLLALGELV